MASDLFGNLFGNMFGSSGLGYQRSTSKNVPLQDVLFNAFQNRDSLFSSSPTASGSFDAKKTSPFFKELSGGGLSWSYDPNWLTGIPQRQWHPGAPPPHGGGHGGNGGGSDEVHGGPAQDPIEWDLGSTPMPTSPPPAPLGPGGKWQWQWDRENPGQGTWVWVTFGDDHERPQY